jgi:hypothetical protein
MGKLWMVFFFLFWAACGAQKKPEGVLTQAQLSSLLIDVYLAEARMESVIQPKDSLIKLFVPHEQKILEVKGVPEPTLRVTYEYYLAHPKELEQVYDAVIDTLVLRDQRLKKNPQTVTPAK